MTTTRPRAVRLSAADNVVVAVEDLAAATELPSEGVAVAVAIPAGHKVAIRAIAEGEAVRKYGQIIGFASQDVAPGDHVHTHNVEVRAFARDYAAGSEARPTDFFPATEAASFDGYVRADGQVATRNYVGVLTTVNCSATVARYIADRFRAMPAEFANVDGVVALTHGYGCGMDAHGGGMTLLQRTIAGYARHPNFAGVLIVGLGCETNQVDALLEATGLSLGDTVQAMTIQGLGGTAASVREGEARVREMLQEANRARRSSVPASELVLGLECGGSDAYSGITANPALGKAADLLVRHGGSAVLGETPEVYGAEHLLTRRASSPEVADKLLSFIRWWEDYTAKNGGQMDNNPSPGNKAGGLTTIYEKSLGAVAKGGATNLVDVVDYAERIVTKGFNFMNTPGYDPVSVTGMVAGGANMVCFTTGRGSVFGCKPVPSLKLATNTPMYESMREDMDINLGPVLDGESLDDAGLRLFDLILQTASGRKSKSEELGFGDEEFTPWQLGAVM